MTETSAVPTPENATIEQLSKLLTEQLSASLDKRDSSLVEKLGNILDEKVKARFEEYERKRAQHLVPGLGADSKDVKNFSFARLISHILSKGKVPAPLEVEMCEAAALTIGKDMATTTDAGGGFIVPTQVFADQIIPLLQSRVIAFELGVTQLSGLSGSPVLIPKVTGGTTAYWVAENAAVTKSDMTFGQIAMTPHALAALSKMSNRFINLSQPAAESIVRQQLGRDVGIALDTAVFNGTGASGQPTGLLQTTGINTTSFGSAVAGAAWNKLNDMITELDKDNALMGKLGWAIDPVTLNKLQQMKDLGTNADDAQPKSRRLFDSQPITTSLLGYPYKSSNTLPANTILFGNWEELVVGQWGTMVVRASDQAGSAFENMQTFILVAMEVDVAVRHPESFVNATSVS